MRTLELVQPFLPHLNCEIFWVFLLGGKIKRSQYSKEANIACTYSRVRIAFYDPYWSFFGQLH